VGGVTPRTPRGCRTGWAWALVVLAEKNAMKVADLTKKFEIAFWLDMRKGFD
jgi:hypothetical protein